MSAHSAHVHNPTNPIPRLPHRPGRILLGGAAVIGGIFAGTWFYMSMKHARKANREPGERGALPSWEYRILQAVDPARALALALARRVQTTRLTRAKSNRTHYLQLKRRFAQRTVQRCALCRNANRAMDWQILNVNPSVRA
ncbi:hypothetical protein BJV74DRAFT_283910 [Russula compacta]|nr:hypothetical protein BJV74DRAFT_283910 [Russula compacta]